MLSRSDREADLFGECLKLAPVDWQGFLDGECDGDRELADRVLKLLRAHETSGDFLESLPASVSKDVAMRLRKIAPAEESSGDQMGRFRLIELLGAGSHGSVWLAEQIEDIKRQVALKILKLGLDTREFLARFEAEKQALAQLDHPHIAKVFDAGSTRFGRPYFVMELVKGKPLFEYADSHRLDLNARLTLFTDICKAIDHAHQNGIIHRDLKPSNILVAEQEARLLPKVIDFGIAKTTEIHLADQALYTQVHAFLGTPVYSSPEQLDYDSGKIDHRSDLYSLGALLYEFLCGQPLFSPERLDQSSLESMRTILREEDPPRPSVRLGTLTLEEQESIAESRGSNPARLEHNLRGDLDWIVMKCLEKEPDRRYESAHALADDLGCFMEHRPVSAAAPSAPYRIKKFVRRNRSRISVGTIVAATFLCALAFLSFVQSQRSVTEYPIDKHDKSLAVLPLRNLSPNPDNAFLAGGIHEDILTFLSRIQSLKVISRTSMTRYEDTDKSMREIGVELGVRYLLQGSVRKAVDRVKVSVQLLDAADGNHVWANDYERALTDVFGIQSAIASEVAEELVGAINAEEQRLLEKAPTENLVAYENYNKARELEIKYGFTARSQQVPFLEKAVEVDPEFVEAWTMLARAYESEEFNLSPSEYSENRFEHALFVAQALAPEHPSVIHSQLWRLAFKYNELDMAYHACQRALERLPLDPQLNLLFAVILDCLGRHEESLAFYDKRIELDPFSYRSNNWIARSYYYYHGDIEKALFHFDRMSEGMIDLQWYRYYKLKFYQTRDLTAISEMENRLKESPVMNNVRWLKVAYGLSDFSGNQDTSNEKAAGLVNVFLPFIHFLEGNETLAREAAAEILDLYEVEKGTIPLDAPQKYPQINFLSNNFAVFLQMVEWSESAQLVLQSYQRELDKTQWKADIERIHQNQYHYLQLLSWMDTEAAVEWLFDPQAGHHFLKLKWELATDYLRNQRLLKHPRVMEMIVEDGAWVDFLADRIPGYARYRVSQ